MIVMPKTSYMSLPGLNPGYGFEGVESKKIENIIKLVEREFNITFKRMQHRDRYREVVEARQVAIYLIRMHTSKPLAYISRMFGGRDHTTAMHSINKIQDMITTEPHFKQLILKIENQLILL